MEYQKKRFGIIPVLAAAVFMMSAVRTNAMDDVYREPTLSGAVETWVYTGQEPGSRTRVYADDLEDGDLTGKIVQTGKLDTTKPGTCTITRQVKDSDGRTVKLDTTVKVLDKNSASAEDKKVKMKLHTLPDASHLTNIGFNRGYYHDRQNLGIWIPADSEIRIRLVNAQEFGKRLKLEFMNDDSRTESSAFIPANGEWVTLKNTFTKDETEQSKDSVPFIVTPKGTDVQPVIEYEWNEQFREIPVYRYGDSQAGFFKEWKESDDPFAIIEGSAATFLVPVIDRDHIIDSDYDTTGKYYFHTIDEMLDWYAAFVDQYDKFAGLDYDAEEPYNQNVRSKFFIKANQNGIGQAYYTVDHSAYNGNSLKQYLYRHWLSLHEFGHGYEGNLAYRELPLVETTNNIMGYYFESSYRSPDDFGWLLSGFSGTREQRYAALGKKAADRRKTSLSFAGIVEGALHYDVSLFMFTNMLDKLGPEKTVAAMHSLYRKSYYENGKEAASSDTIAESFSRSGGYNVLPYLESWHIHPSSKTENTIYDMDQPMLYYLKDLIPDDAECEQVRSKLGLDGIYSLVSTGELASTGYKSRVSIQIEMDDLEQIRNKYILIKDGSDIVKKLPVTGKTLETELPVGIYEVELPVPKGMGYRYGNEYLTASKGNVTKTVTYKKEQGNPLADDVKIRLLGLSDSIVAEASVDTGSHKLTWTINGIKPHEGFQDVYISIRVTSQDGKELFNRSMKGNEKAVSGSTEMDFPAGAKLEIYHKEAGGRLVFVSKDTGETLSSYRVSGNDRTITYVMTENGLMQTDWDESERKNAYMDYLMDYSRFQMQNMTQSDARDPAKFHNEKMTMQMAYEKLDEGEKAEYQAVYGTLIGVEPESYARYAKLDGQSFQVFADSEQPGSEAAIKAVDGDENTFWHTNYSGGTMPDIEGGKNNSFTILLPENTDIGKLEYLPRQQGNNGIILKYSLSYSTTEDQDDFVEIPVRNPGWTEDSRIKSVEFDAPNARRIRICALATAGMQKDTHISAAEFSLYEKYEVSPGYTWLSDLYMDTDASNGTVYKDKNGHGQNLELCVSGRKKEFSKGIGLTAGTVAVWDLTGKNVDVFSAWAGTDNRETAGTYASVEIYGDGTLLYQSEALYAGDPAESVYLNVHQVKKLEIRETGGKVPVSLANAKFLNSSDKTEITLKQGETAAIVENSSLIPADRGKVSWTVQDPSVATVDQNGMITAVGEGNTKVQAVFETGSLSCTVHVEKLPQRKQEEQVDQKPADGSQTETQKQQETEITVPSNPDKKVEKPKKVKLKKIRISGKKATVSWKKTAKADGYEVWVKAGKKPLKKMKSVSARKTSVTLGGMKKGQKYLFQVRAYRKNGAGKKIYGPFAKVTKKY